MLAAHARYCLPRIESRLNRPHYFSARKLLRNTKVFIRNLWLAATGRVRDLQQSSNDFWRDCSYTYLADSAYYDKRHAALTGALASLPKMRAAIDVGCGDGRFTRVLAQHAGTTVGFDISPALIDQARRRAINAGEGAAQFQVASIDEIPTTLGPFGLVACMGVLSCLVDEVAYLRALGRCASMVEPSGYLLLVDTLAEKREFTRTYRNGYVARYRNVDAYERVVLDAGFSLISRQTVARMGPATVNYLYLFRRQPV